MKIAVYGIALNEEAFAERFVAACRDADLILVADTGSTDGTREKLAALGVDVRSVSIQPWRFDHARNAALDLLPDDVDICISMDLDQVLAPGWRPLLLAAWARGVNRAYYTHMYSRHAAGTEESFLDCRIHARFGFRWRYPCHESVFPMGVEERAVILPALRVEHFPDPNKPRTDYLPLLKLAAEENPSDERSAHYLGREYYTLERFPEAAAEFERHLALPTGVITAERSASMRYLAHCREKLGDAEGALALFRQACAETPMLRGTWVELSWAMFRRQVWPECLAAAQRAMQMPGGNLVYGDETAYGVVAEDLVCLACWALGRRDEALDYGRRALALSPGSPRIAGNVAEMERLMGLAPPAQPAAGST